MSPHGEYLTALGERVRLYRRARGLSRNELASASGVSLRRLASLEAGDGNLSILKFRSIARALDVPLAELLKES